MECTLLDIWESGAKNALDGVQVKIISIKYELDLLLTIVDAAFLAIHFFLLLIRSQKNEGFFEWMKIRICET